MAEPLCCRFVEVVNSDVSSCGFKISTTQSNHVKDRLLGSHVAALRPSLASVHTHIIASRSSSLCRNENPSFDPSFELRLSSLTYWKGSASTCHSNSEPQFSASSCPPSAAQDAASSLSLASVSAQQTCNKDNPKDARSMLAGGDTNNINDTYDNDHPRDIRSTLAAGDTNNINATYDFHMNLTTSTVEFMISDTQNAHPENKMHFSSFSLDSNSSADQAHYACDSGSTNSDVLKSDQSLMAALHADDAVGDVDDAVGDECSGTPMRAMGNECSGTPMRADSCLQKVKPSSKIEEAHHRMKATFRTFDIQSLVFRELGKRQEWSTIDTLVRDEVKLSEGESNCEVFNKLFEVCITQDAPIWASKWFSFMMQEGVQPDFITFRLLMSLFRRHNMVEDAKFSYQHMIGIGIECFTASSAMVLLHIRAGQLEKAKQIFIKMQEANEECLDSFLVSELNSHVRNGNVKQAEELVKFMQECGVRLDLFIYKLMITVNGKAGEFSRAKEWFFCIEEDGLEPNEATYRSIIGACGRAGSLYDALQFYDKMVALNFLPSLVNYNTLIHLHRKLDHEGRILAILSDMKTAGCLPDSATFNSVLKVYERYGRLKKLPEALRLLREAGWEPNDVCYGLLIRAYIRCNMVDEAMEVFGKLCEVAKLEEIMCHNLICMCKSAGRYDEAIHIFNEMRRLENVGSYLRTSRAVIEVYSLRGAIKEGEAIYKELRLEHGLDAATYGMVLNMYLEAGLLDKAAEVVREVLREEELGPGIHLFLCMLKVCTQYDLREEAVELYWRIVKCKMVWTKDLYTEVIHCCGRLLPVEEILNVFDAMMAAKTSIDTATSNVLLDIFVKARVLDKSECVFRLAQNQGVHDCITFSMMIEAYGRKKKFSEMESVLQEMLDAGYRECADAYNSMLDAYGSSGLMKKVEYTFSRMRMAGCVPNLTTFDVLIKLYGQGGLIKDLQGVLDKIKKAGLKLEGHSYRSLIHAYGSLNMLDESLEYFHEMQKVGFEPDLNVYTHLMSGLRAGGYGKDAARLSQWINSGGMM